jgi:hypothetical protein
MRPLTMALAVASTLLLSFTLPTFAQEEGKAPTQSQPQTAPAPPQTVPVQPQRTPQQSEQYRKEDRSRGEDVRIGRDWTAQEPEMGRDWDHRKPGRDWRMRRDYEDDRGYYDDDRPRHRVKICFEYENGDEYCRYRR